MVERKAASDERRGWPAAVPGAAAAGVPRLLRGLLVCVAGCCALPLAAQTPMTKCVGAGRTSYVQSERCPPGQQPVDLNLPALSTMDAGALVPGSSHMAPGRVKPGKPAGGSTADLGTGTVAGAGGTPAARPTRPGPCAGLARQIEAVDAEARQPQSAARQDALRERRRGLRQRQADWSCR